MSKVKLVDKEDIALIGGVSVSRRIKGDRNIKAYPQPKALVHIKSFDKVVLGSGIEEIDERDDLHYSIEGTVVDYLTRFVNGTPIEEAFHIPLLGVQALYEQENIDERMYATELMAKIKKDLSDESIIAACRLTRFDVCYRAGVGWYLDAADDAHTTTPNNAAIHNIRLMVERAKNFFDIYGPVVVDGPTFKGAYTPVIRWGDADFATEDTLWDFKTYKNEPNNRDTLQLFTYFVMGKHSDDERLKRLTKIGIYNPKFNIAYILDTSKITPAKFIEVEYKVIGYGTEYPTLD